MDAQPKQEIRVVVTIIGDVVYENGQMRVVNAVPYFAPNLPLPLFDLVHDIVARGASALHRIERDELLATAQEQVKNAQPTSPIEPTQPT